VAVHRIGFSEITADNELPSEYNPTIFNSPEIVKSDPNIKPIGEKLIWHKAF
jgi:hypothetical protein